jgi:hypothetical protein
MEQYVQREPCAQVAYIKCYFGQTSHIKRFILMSSFHLRLALSVGHFPSDKHFYAFLILPMRAAYPKQFTDCGMTSQLIFGYECTFWIFPFYESCFPFPTLDLLSQRIYLFKIDQFISIIQKITYHHVP